MMDSPEKILCKEYGSQGGEDHLVSLNWFIMVKLDWQQSCSQITIKGLSPLMSFRRMIVTFLRKTRTVA
ncbi:hypothetical protein [Xenorhabdus nematophila]|uniref:hypothetical protein n=2 Tax=Xenorhabdus nematophila TaxID=628 RepID=UPI000907AADF|nr:hypothetical protein [Xenorhabdus nematophila]AYA41115.1 hypothetical protein D3790_12215 [Xenorhabdus nematophila]MCB4427056.1 hypothetical protein [Xenorhabdus nematophila]